MMLERGCLQLYITQDWVQADTKHFLSSFKQHALSNDMGVGVGGGRKEIREHQKLTPLKLT